MSYIVIVGSLISFFIGCFIADYKFVWTRRRHASESKYFRYWSVYRIRLTILISFLIGIIVWGYLFLRVGGLQVFLKEPNIYRHNFLLPIVDDIYKFMFLSSFIIVYYIAIGEKKFLLPMILAYATNLVLISSRLARYDLFILVVVSVMIFHLLKEIRLWHIILIVIIMSMAFGIIQYYRAGQFERERELIASGVAKAPEKIPSLVSIYLYTIPNIRNVQIGIEETVNHEWGRNLFFPLWSFTRTAKFMGFESHSFSYWRSIYGLGIFRPYLIDFYRDFGVVGTMFLPALIGFLSSRIYNRARLLRRPLDMLLYALVSYCLIFSFIDNTFSDSGIWLFAIMFSLLNVFCRRSNFTTS
jgi:oligosaccharide repeat unit polymerase